MMWRFFLRGGWELTDPFPNVERFLTKTLKKKTRPLIAPQRGPHGGQKTNAPPSLSLISNVVPLASGVNHTKQIVPQDATTPVRIADGNPGPPVPPPPRDLGMQTGVESVIIADGNPGPPVPPPPRALGQIADGYRA